MASPKIGSIRQAAIAPHGVHLLEEIGGATTHQLDRAAITALSQCPDGVDRIRALKGNIKKDQIRMSTQKPLHHGLKESELLDLMTQPLQRHRDEATAKRTPARTHYLA